MPPETATATPNAEETATTQTAEPAKQTVDTQQTNADKIMDKTAEKAAEKSATSATEEKKDETKQVEKKDEAKPDQKTDEAKKAPEKYDLKIPDGSLLTKDAIVRIEKIAKDKGFSNDDAQGLVEYEHEAVKAFAAGQEKQLAEAAKVWRTEAENDKEIGGEKFKENVTLASRVVSKFGTDAFKAELNKTGLGNHPELIRIFTRIGRVLGEDVLVTGTVGQAAKVSPADKLYPSMSKAT